MLSEVGDSCLTGVFHKQKFIGNKLCELELSEEGQKEYYVDHRKPRGILADSQGSKVPSESSHSTLWRPELAETAFLSDPVHQGAVRSFSADVLEDQADRGLERSQEAPTCG